MNYDLMSYIGRPLTDTFAMHDEKTSKKLLDSYLTFNHMHLDKDSIPMFPGVKEDLFMLKDKGICQGVVTSKGMRPLMSRLSSKGFGISLTFTFVRRIRQNISLTASR